MQIFMTRALSRNLPFPRFRASVRRRLEQARLSAARFVARQPQALRQSPDPALPRFHRQLKASTQQGLRRWWHELVSLTLVSLRNRPGSGSWCIASGRYVWGKALPVTCTSAVCVLPDSACLPIGPDDAARHPEPSFRQRYSSYPSTTVARAFASDKSKGTFEIQRCFSILNDRQRRDGIKRGGGLRNRGNAHVWRSRRLDRGNRGIPQEQRLNSRC